MNNDARFICLSLARIFLLIWLATSYSAVAGEPEPSVPPGTGTMKSLQEIYDKLDAIEGALGGSTPPSSGSYISIPQTGQTQAYVTGDDGHYKKGANWPDPRFTSNGDGTTTDKLTGLVWLRNNWCPELRDMNWEMTIDAVNNLQDGDCYLNDGSVVGDWRLPNRNELMSLIDWGHWQSVLPLDWSSYFVYGTGAYWTSTSFAGDPANRAWAVWFTTGYVVPNRKSVAEFEDTTSYPTGHLPIGAWPVRSSNN